MYARDSMKSPCVYHFLCHISDPDSFNKSDFIKNFKRALNRQYKDSAQQTPDSLLIYSIEFKYTNQGEVENNNDAYDKGKGDGNKIPILIPFLHIHICLIADCKYTIPQAVNNRAVNALNEIKGLSKARYFKSKDMYVNVFDDERKEMVKTRISPKLYKSLKSDFDDVYDRVKYFAKIEQKENQPIPFRQSFGSSRIPKFK